MELEPYLIVAGVAAATVGIVECQTRGNLYFRLNRLYGDEKIKEKPTFWNSRRLFKKYINEGMRIPHL